MQQMTRLYLQLSDVFIGNVTPSGMRQWLAKISKKFILKNPFLKFLFCLFNGKDDRGLVGVSDIVKDIVFKIKENSE